jgi:hypothetical protein
MEQWNRTPNPGIAPHRPSVMSDGFSYFISECGGGEMEGVSQKHLKAGDSVVRSAVGYATVPVETSVPDRHRYSISSAVVGAGGKTAQDYSVTKTNCSRDFSQGYLL